MYESLINGSHGLGCYQAVGFKKLYFILRGDLRRSRILVINFKFEMMKENEHPFLVSMNLLEKKMEQLLRVFKLNQIQNPELIILDNAEFMQMFKISSKTAQTWRDEGLINYVQVKGKIFYKLKDIQVFLSQHYK